MERTTSDLTFHGVVGGVIASAVVAVWFLAVDLGAGDAFGTPARLASAILGEEFQGTWPRLIVVFSILHVGVFAVLGGLSTNALRWLGIDPGLMVGVVFGIGVLNAVHYVSLLVTGNNLLTIVPVVHVTGANIIGGMLMMAYVHRATQAESPFGWDVFKGHPVLHRGIITGAVGAATVALWLFAVDIIRGIPFHTPAGARVSHLAWRSGCLGCTDQPRCNERVHGASPRGVHGGGYHLLLARGPSPPCLTDMVARTGTDRDSRGSVLWVRGNG